MSAFEFFWTKLPGLHPFSPVPDAYPWDSGIMIDMNLRETRASKKDGKHAAKFDAIVVGAGPAGAQCARELSKKGRTVLLMEKSQRIGEPNFSSAGTPTETIRDFDLPLSVTKGVWSKVLMRANHYPCLWDYKKTRGYVFDFRELKKFLVKDAIAGGARIMVGTSAEAPIMEKGIVCGVRYGGIYGKGEARARRDFLAVS